MMLLNRERQLVIFFLIICITSSLSIVNVKNKVTDRIDIYQYYEDLNMYDFKVLGTRKEISIESTSNSVKVSWKDLAEKVYISSFDNSVSIEPSNRYADMCTVPEGSKSIQLDVSIQGTYREGVNKDFDLYLYLITYDENGQVASANKEVVLDSTLERARNHTLKLKIDEKSKKYKVLLRIQPRNCTITNGYFTLSNMDISFDRSI